MALTKAQILSADDLPREEVSVPEWGGSVLVSTMNLADMVAALGEAIKAAPPEKVLSVILAYTLVDEAGASSSRPTTLRP